MQVDQQLTEHNTEEMRKKVFSKYTSEKLKKILKTMLVEQGDHSDVIKEITIELEKRGE